MISIRLIRIVDDTYTVEFEYESEEPADFVSNLSKSQMGRKAITLLDKAFGNVEEFAVKSALEEVQAYEENLKEQGRQEVIKAALDKGLDLTKFLPKKEEESED